MLTLIERLCLPGSSLRRYPFSYKGTCLINLGILLANSPDWAEAEPLREYLLAS